MPDPLEPTPITESRLSLVLEQLVAREPIFHRPELGTSRQDFERMIEAEFWEVGASGQRYGREYVLNELERRYGNGGDAGNENLRAEEFHCRELAENLYLLTYTLFQGPRESRRATIWRLVSGEWKIVYHQGTLVSRATS
jgi:hypothetical protein